MKVLSVSIHTPVLVAGAFDPYTSLYPAWVPVKIEITLAGDKKVDGYRKDFHGFYSDPFTWDECKEKFTKLSKEFISAERRRRIINVIEKFEKKKISDLIDALVQPDEPKLTAPVKKARPAVKSSISTRPALKSKRKRMA